MIAEFQRVEVSIADSGHAFDVDLTLKNRSEDTWSAACSDAASYQIYDAETDRYLSDGPRVAFTGDVSPQTNTQVSLPVTLPSQPGKYRVLISPVREGVRWFFQNGSPCLRLDAEVSSGGVRLLRQAVVTRWRLARERWAATLHRAVTYPLRTLSAHRSLIRSMVRRDIAGRYRGSYGGMFWTVFHPLLMMLTYWFVFGLVLRTRFGDDGRPSNFVVYFLAGMLPWLAVSEALGRAATVVLEHANFVKKIVFPLEILPVTLVLAGLVSQAFGVGIFLIALLGFGYPVPATVLWIPVILVPQVLLTLGLAWFLAALGTFFRDLSQVIGFLLTVWFFTTPICYPVSHLPQSYLWIFDKNPMFVLVAAYRAVFLEATSPEWTSLLVLTVVSGLLFFVGHAWFYRLKKSFADII